MQRPAAFAAIALFLSLGAHQRALASADWFQGPNGNLGVCTVGGDQWYPAAIPDGSGGALTVWQDHRSADPEGYDIYAQHVLGTGVNDPTWTSQGVALTLAQLDQRFPTLCTDGAGGAYVAWSDYSSPNVYAQHLLSNGTVDPFWAPNGDLVCNSANSSQTCDIVSDGLGGAYVCWSDIRFVAVNPGPRVYVSHLLSSGVDPSWTANGIRVCASEASQLSPVMCSDGAHGVFLAWNDQRNPTRDIYGTRVLVNGTLGLPAAGTPVCVATGNQRVNGGSGSSVYIINWNESQANAIAPDGAGGFLVTWADERAAGTSGLDVYMQRMNSNGTVAGGWPANGTAACAAAGDQVLPTLLPDGTGGATVFWNDGRPGAWVQHVTGSGIADGAVDGLLIDALGTGFPFAVRDGGTGAIVSYQKLESGDYNLYAQHMINAPYLHNDPAWPAAGLAVSTHSGTQWSGTMVRDNAGGAVAIWTDSRDSVATGFDMYAQRVLATGVLPVSGASVPPSASAHGLLRIDPNPLTAGADIRYAVAARSRVRIVLYDVVGRKTLALEDGVEESGDHVVRFTRPRGSMRDGVYFLRMVTEPLAGGSRIVTTLPVAVIH